MPCPSGTAGSPGSGGLSACPAPGRSLSHARCCFSAFPVWDFRLQRGHRGVCPCPRPYVPLGWFLGTEGSQQPLLRGHSHRASWGGSCSQPAFAFNSSAGIPPEKGRQPKAVRVSSCDCDLLAERSRAAATWPLPCPCSQPAAAAAASHGRARGCSPACDVSGALQLLLSCRKMGDRGWQDGRG